MLRSKLFRGAFIGLVVLWVLHMLGIHLFLYWQLWWYDLMMHCLGGFVAGLGAMWCLSTWPFFRRFPALTSSLFPLLLIIFITGGAWELFEYAIGNSFPEGHSLDVISDLIADLAGAVLAYVSGRTYFA